MDLYTSPKIWGPHLWYMLRCFANNYPINPTNNDATHMKIFFHELQYLLPCETCKYTYAQHINKNPIDNVLDSREKLIEWVERIYDVTKKEISDNRIRVLRHAEDEIEIKPKKINHQKNKEKDVIIEKEYKGNKSMKLDPKLKPMKRRQIILNNAEKPKIKPKIEYYQTNNQLKPYVPYDTKPLLNNNKNNYNNYINNLNKKNNKTQKLVVTSKCKKCEH